jgi:hypothetical protein
MEERKSEGHNTDQFPGDGHEKILDVRRTGLCALNCRPWVRPRPWRRSDDVALLGPRLGDRREKDSRNSGPSLSADYWHGTDNVLCVWSSATTFDGHLLHRQGRKWATYPFCSRSSLSFA